MYCICIYFAIVVATIDTWDACRESVPIHVGRMCQYNSSPLGDHKHEIPSQPTLPKSLLNLQMKYNVTTNSKLILWSSSKEISIYNPQQQMIFLSSLQETYRKP